MMDRVPKNPGFWVLKCFKKHVLLSVSFYTIFVLMQYLEIPSPNICTNNRDLHLHFYYVKVQQHNHSSMWNSHDSKITLGKSQSVTT